MIAFSFMNSFSHSNFSNESSFWNNESSPQPGVKRKRVFSDEPTSKRRNTIQPPNQTNSNLINIQQQQSFFINHQHSQNIQQNKVDSMEILSENQTSLETSNSLAIVLYRPPEEILLGLNNQSPRNSNSPLHQQEDDEKIELVYAEKPSIQEDLMNE